MKKIKLSFKSSRFFANNWVVTLTATMAGVFMALYLNECSDSNKLESKKRKAVKYLLEEIAYNDTLIKKSIKGYTRFIDLMGLIETGKENKEGKRGIELSVVDLNDLRGKYPEYILVKDSIYVKEGVYRYRMEVNTNFELSYFNLKTIAWETLKVSGLTTELDFECLKYLEEVETMIREINQKEKKFADYFMSIYAHLFSKVTINGNEESEEVIEDVPSDKVVKTMNNNHKSKNRIDKESIKLLIEQHLNFLVMYQKGLSNMYKRKNEGLKNCM